MEIRNTIDQEMQTRHARLLSDVLGVLNMRADPFGHAWVEVVDETRLRVHSRYVELGATHEITQEVYVTSQSKIIHQAPSQLGHSPDGPGRNALQ